MGTTWGRQDPGGLHADHMNFAICDINENSLCFHFEWPLSYCHSDPDEQKFSEIQICKQKWHFIQALIHISNSFQMLPRWLEYSA